METDRDYQLSNLAEIYLRAYFPPVFKDNPKYPGDGVPCICLGDVLHRKYIVRWGDYTTKIEIDENCEVIAEYPSAEALVDDGWRLD